MTPAARIHQANTAALDYWAGGPNHAAATTYLRGRGIHPEDLPDTYRIGYARPGWTTLTDRLTTAGYTGDELLDAGLVIRLRDGRAIDRFRHRVMLPIRTLDGDVAGFIGRAVCTTGDAPKYLNTPASAAYDKSSLLYGFHEAVRSGGVQPVLVEGPLDALAVATAAHIAGERDLLPVAACGTALTAQHADLITSWCREHHTQPVIAYDADPPGRAAALRAAEHLRVAGLHPTVAVLPTGLDPADHLTAGGDLRPFRPTPAGTATPLPAAVAHQIIDTWHRRGNPEWADTKVVIARSIADYIRSYPPAGRDSVGWPRRDGGKWPHFATRRAVVTQLFGPTR